MTTDTVGLRTDNPYVGPRSFRRGDPLYGRTAECNDLRDLVVSERIVLVYSPSGAGKSSLLNAALFTALEEVRLEVLPVVKVGHVPPLDLGGVPVRNRYVLSALLSLEEGVPPDHQLPAELLATMTLDEYLRARPDMDGVPGNEVLVFDQFEDILTADPTDEAGRREFFVELGAALRDRTRWAVFAMREDFLAALDPYVRHIPTRLATRYRLDLLTAEQALEAVIEPARHAGVTFERDAAQQLVDDLRRVRAQRPDGPADVLGQYVEPVQLQVACTSLWSRLQPGATRIDETDGIAQGGVEHALSVYYDMHVEWAAWSVGVPSGLVRDWFEERLITPQGLRGQDFAGPLRSGPADAALLTRLIDAHLVRAEHRRQATWYELTHDRFVAPIRGSNAAWRHAHTTPFERGAQQWAAESQPEHLLFTGPALAQAEAYLAGRRVPLAPREAEFLTASRALDARRRRERRTTRVLAALVVALAIVGVMAGAAFVNQVSAQQESARHRLLLAASNALQWNQEAGVGLTAEVAGELDVGDIDDVARDVLYRSASASGVTAVMGEQEDVVLSFDVAEDGRMIVVATLDGVTLWTRDPDGAGTVTPDMALELPEETFVLGGLDLSRDQSTAAAALDDRSVVVWDVATGASEVWPAGDEDVFRLALAPDGSAVATTDVTGVLRLHDRHGVELPLEPTTTGIWYADFSPDGTLLAGAGDLVTSLWDLPTGAAAGTIPHGSGGAVSFGPDSRSVATISYDGTMTVWNLDTLAQTSQSVPPESVVGGATYPSVDLTRRVDVLADGRVSVSDATTGEIIAVANVPGAAVLAAVVDPADEGQIIVLPDQGAASIWRTELTAAPAAVAIDAGVTYTVWADGRVRTTPGSVPTAPEPSTDAAPRAERPVPPSASVDPSAPPLASALDRAAPPLAAAVDRSAFLPKISSAVPDAGAPAAERDQVVAFDADTASHRGVTVARSGRATAMDLDVGGDAVLVDSGAERFRSASIGGPVVATIDDAGQVELWDALDGTSVRLLELSDGYEPEFVELSADGARALVALTADAVWRGAPVALLVDVEEGTSLELALAEGRSWREVITAAAFSADTDTVVLGTSLGAVIAFDAASGDQVWEEGPHQRKVSTLTFAADRIVTTSADGRVWVAEGDTGTEVRSVPVEAHLVGASLTPDGGAVIAVTAGGSEIELPLDDAELLRVVEDKVTRELTAKECAQFSHDVC
ncbi:NACHT and WD repeat domain-containing protein [Cellulomonas humilata]|uniref:WD40 repeat protein n=1 Tax=Cellulomonas humilata TaxID=144055 RepID=A0ABU0EFA3_9CELL|nr:PQQ-binding-like beta-propeller repeat protein [Cellulomonas humilata]MDQ0373955.1 WD40 repeat protein [Cellulomonas humilata]